jgi:hypothetical protein
MGLQIQFTDPEGYNAASRYLRFARDHCDLCARPESWAEVGLIYPRQAVWNRHPEAVDSFRSLGHALVDNHVLFDVIWDQKMTAARLARYSVIVAPGREWLSEKQRATLAAYERERGLVLHPGDAGAVLEQIARRGLSRVNAPWTLRVAGYTRPGRRILHFVNYNRDEQRGAAIKGPAGECPLPVTGVEVDLRIPPGPKVRSVHVLSPDNAGPPGLEWKQEGGRLRFQLPPVEVYTVVEIRYT